MQGTPIKVTLVPGPHTMKLSISAPNPVGIVEAGVELDGSVMPARLGFTV